MDPAVKHRRVLAAIQVVLERCALEADTEDPEAEYNADALLMALDNLMGPARAARIQDAARVRNEQSAVRERQAVADEAEKRRILGEERSVGVDEHGNSLVKKAPAPLEDTTSPIALARAERRRLVEPSQPTAEPRKIVPTPIDGETAKGLAKWKAHRAEQKKAK